MLYESNFIICSSKTCEKLFISYLHSSLLAGELYNINKLIILVISILYVHNGSFEYATDQPLKIKYNSRTSDDFHPSTL